MSDSITKFLDTKLCQTLGVSVVFIGLSWLFWEQMNVHIDGRFDTQEARITELVAQNTFFREYAEKEQSQRLILFTAIEKHLGEISGHN